MKRNKKTNFGFTIIELLVSMSILLIISGVAVSIFVSSVLEQRRILEKLEVLGQFDYVLEYMSKSLRMAGKDLTGDCLGSEGRNYLLTRYDSAEGAYLGIKFINQSDNNICQEFYLDKDVVSGLTTIKEIKGVEIPTVLTSDKIKINFLKFVIDSDESVENFYSSVDDNIQPRITIFIDANLYGSNESSTKIQTTISQRVLNIE